MRKRFCLFNQEHVLLTPFDVTINDVCRSLEYVMELMIVMITAMRMMVVIPVHYKIEDILRIRYFYAPFPLELDTKIKSLFIQEKHVLHTHSHVLMKSVFL